MWIAVLHITVFLKTNMNMKTHFNVSLPASKWNVVSGGSLNEMSISLNDRWVWWNKILNNIFPCQLVQIVINFLAVDKGKHFGQLFKKNKDFVILNGERWWIWWTVLNTTRYIDLILSPILILVDCKSYFTSTQCHLVWRYENYRDTITRRCLFTLYLKWSSKRTGLTSY